MNRFRILTLFAFFIMPLLTGCQSINSSENRTEANQGNHSFLTYTAPNEPRITIALALMAELGYDDGCLFVFNGNQWLTPVFPKGDAEFDTHSQTLKLLNINYKMGDVVLANGYTAVNSRFTADFFDNTIPEKCIKEDFAIFFGGYEKTVWNQSKSFIDTNTLND